MPTPTHSSLSSSLEPLAFQQVLNTNVGHSPSTRRKSDKFVVESQQLDGTGRKLVVTLPGHVERIAYDWVGHNIYWMGGGQISVTSLGNNTYQRTLLQDTMAESLALNANDGKMYWSVWDMDSGHSGRIEQSWMDGSHRAAFVNATKTGPMHFPSSLTVDGVERKLYWCDRGTMRIERVGLDGGDRQVILASGQGMAINPHSVAYHNQFVFWSDQDFTIYRLHIDNTASTDVSK